MSTFRCWFSALHSSVCLQVSFLCSIADLIWSWPRTFFFICLKPKWSLYNWINDNSNFMEKLLPFHISDCIAHTQPHSKVKAQKKKGWRRGKLRQKRREREIESKWKRITFATNIEYNLCSLSPFTTDAVIKSTPFFLISGFILIVSYMVLMLAMCSQRHSVLFFFSGIFFIIAGMPHYICENCSTNPNYAPRSLGRIAPHHHLIICNKILFNFWPNSCAGLVMLIGIIMYISLFKSEVGSKLRPRSMFQPPLFAYRYGHSFILFVVGCISAEIVGTLNFFLYIRIREIGREKVIIALNDIGKRYNRIHVAEDKSVSRSTYYSTATDYSVLPVCPYARENRQRKYHESDCGRIEKTASA